MRIDLSGESPVVDDDPIEVRRRLRTSHGVARANTGERVEYDTTRSASGYDAVTDVVASFKPDVSLAPANVRAGRDVGIGHPVHPFPARFREEAVVDSVSEPRRVDREARGGAGGRND